MTPSLDRITHLTATAPRTALQIAGYRQDRASLRDALRYRWSMNDADRWERLGVLRPRAHDRFVRLWAWSTATEHPLTRGVPLDRWRARRERIRRAIAALTATTRRGA